MELTISARQMSHRVVFLLCLVIAVMSASCKSSPTSPDIPDEENGLWTIYTPYNWAHDGQPCRSTYCIVYSDDASSEMKQQMADIADERFRQIMQLFDFHSVSDFIYPPGGSKIEIYINRNHPENIAWAYWGGFIITIRSEDISGHWNYYAVYTSRHELTHIFEFLIEGREVLGSCMWFKEGIAVHIGCLEATEWQTVESLSELEAWISQNQNVPGQGNPIKIRQSSDLPPGADWHEYYRFFELAVRYLFDSRGLGKSFVQVRDLFYDMREGIPFPVSFQEKFGISLEDYEIEFYDRMRAYLSSTRK